MCCRGYPWAITVVGDRAEYPHTAAALAPDRLDDQFAAGRIGDDADFTLIDERDRLGVREVGVAAVCGETFLSTSAQSAVQPRGWRATPPLC
ncbi:hypothetical protein [Sphingomonas sp. MMS24-J13]|uniref:hypothetical protein n=1 Tax=Sphingomonas sp. MMS24-J13 TaxID=3238686 RepID=UPI00384C571E